MKNKDVIYLLYTDLEYRLSQNGCGCNHPACNRCSDDRDTRNVLDIAKAQFPDMERPKP